MKLRIAAGAGLVLSVLAPLHAYADAPAWCKVPGADPLSPGNTTDLYKATDARGALPKIVELLCYPDAEAKDQARQIEAYRQTWSKKLGFSEADWTDIAVWAHHRPSERNAPSLATRDATAWTAFSPIEQYAAILEWRGSRADPSYVADALGAKLTETGRLGYIRSCLSPNGDDVGARWAMCEHDIAVWDPKKLVDEVRTDSTRDGLERIIIRLIAYETATIDLPKHAAAVKALRAKDPAYDKMFVLADGAIATFAKADPKLVALATEIDDARVSGSRKAATGCEAKTWAAFRDHVASLGAKTFAGMEDRPGDTIVGQAAAVLAHEPNGYLASLALVSCTQLNNQYPDALIKMLGSGLQRWPGFRGPRSSAQTAIQTAGLQLDARDARLDYPELDRNWISATGAGGTWPFGSIASIKTVGDKTTITFAKESIRQTRCTKGHYTNRISQILDNGSVIYYYVCDATVDETISVAPSAPQTVDARYATALAKGMTAKIAEGIVYVAYAKGGTKVPVVIAGVGVK